MAKKFCEMSTVDLTVKYYKSTVAFSDYMNFEIEKKVF